MPSAGWPPCLRPAWWRHRGSRRRRRSVRFPRETGLDPAALLGECRTIESERGRDRAGKASVRWGPRTLDLDIVRFGDRVVRTATLTIPHPELPHRDFWLREIAELDALPVTHG